MVDVRGGEPGAVWLEWSGVYPGSCGLRWGWIDGHCGISLSDQPVVREGISWETTSGSMAGEGRRVSRFPGITMGTGSRREGSIGRPRTGGLSRGRLILYGAGAEQDFMPITSQINVFNWFRGCFERGVSQFLGEGVEVIPGEVPDVPPCARAGEGPGRERPSGGGTGPGGSGRP